MTAPMRHPSFLELDRAALGLRSPSLEAHLQACTECVAYLGRVTQVEPVPAWVRTLGSETRGSRSAGWKRLAWPLMATAALASVAMLLVVVLPRQPEEESPRYVASKDAPAVAVHIKRGDQVFQWDGQAPLEPEDRIRLRVASSEYRYVTVAARSPEGPEAWTLLFAGPLSAEPETVLPASWRVDATPGDELLRVLFSMEPLPEPEALELISEAPRTERLWTTELRLAKSPR